MLCLLACSLSCLAPGLGWLEQRGWPSCGSLSPCSLSRGIAWASSQHGTLWVIRAAGFSPNGGSETEFEARNFESQKAWAWKSGAHPSCPSHWSEQSQASPDSGRGYRGPSLCGTSAIFILLPTTMPPPPQKGAGRAAASRC